MEVLNQIVNLNLHPINKDVYIKSCNKEIFKNSSLQLDNFLNLKALIIFQSLLLKIIQERNMRF